MRHAGRPVLAALHRAFNLAVQAGRLIGVLLDLVDNGYRIELEDLRQIGSGRASVVLHAETMQPPPEFANTTMSLTSSHQSLVD